MAEKYITLEEAAQRVGVSPTDFKRRLKTEWTHLTFMRDGSTLQFRVSQIDELARQLGAASDPELHLAPLDQSAEHGSDDFKLSPKPKKPVKPAEEPLVFDGSDDDIFSLSGDDAKPGAPKSKGKGDADSDVRLEGAKPPSKNKNAAAVPTEEIALDLSGPGSAVIKGGSAAKLSAPKSSTKLSAGSDSGKNKNLSAPGTDSSEFELSLDADSSDFELQLNADSSDEVDLGSSPVDPASPGAKSGINLRDPADSGVSLEKGKKADSAIRRPESGIRKPDSGLKKPDSSRTGAKKPPVVVDDSDDFELSLESDSGSGTSGLRRPATPKPGKAPVTSDSDSEFELTLDDSGSSLDVPLPGEQSKGDIFETDFEIPPMAEEESGSEAVALESDTDLEAAALEEADVAAEDDTGSEVVLLEDEPEVTAPTRPASSRRRQAAVATDTGDVDLADVELEEGPSASAALRGVRHRRDDDEDEDEEETVPSERVAAPAPWGPLPAIILFPALLILTLGGLMGYELLHTMMGYQQPRKPAAPLVRSVAKSLDMELRDQ